MSSVEHTNASHFNCLPFSKVTNEANGTDMRCMNKVKGNTDFANMLQQLSHDAVIIKDTSNQHSDTERFADTPTKRWLQTGKRISFTHNNIRT